MSLIVCSNKLESGNVYDRSSEDQSSAKFRNHLVNTLQIPANSEIAVQSVKVNKDGLSRISNQSRWFQFFNQNLRTNADVPKISSSNLSTGMPIMCTPDMLDSSQPAYVNADEFVTRMTTGMKLGMPHPDLNRTTTKCEVMRDATGGTTGEGFFGYKMTYDYLSTPTANLFTQDYSKMTDAFGEDSAITISDAGTGETKFTCTRTADDDLNHNVVWANEYPISHNKGILTYNLAGLVEPATIKLNGGWSLGLARGTPSRNKLNNVVYGNHGGDFSRYQHHYDYVVTSEQLVPGGNFFLKIGQLSVDHSGGNPNPGSPLIMNEIMYWDNTAGDFPNSIWTTPFVSTQSNDTGYNLSTNIQHFDTLRFIVRNEQVTIEIMSSTGTGLAAAAGEYFILTSYSLRGSLGAKKASVPKPAGQTCWNLYPKVMIRTTGRHVEQTVAEMRDTGYKSTDPDGDWFVRQVTQGHGQQAYEVDSRYYNNLALTDFYVQKGTTGTLLTRTLTGYESIMIVKPDFIHYLETNLANMALRLGFASRGVLDSGAGTVTDQKVIYLSDREADLTDFSSQFVRLDNWTQLSYNAGTGRPSKILYHMPRFDTSNREVGSGLYFEPQERVYIKMNNTDPLPANEFHLSICDNKERLIEDLSGQTIICLHVRDSMTPLTKLGSMNR